MKIWNIFPPKPVTAKFTLFGCWWLSYARQVKSWDYCVNTWKTFYYYTSFSSFWEVLWCTQLCNLQMRPKLCNIFIIITENEKMVGIHCKCNTLAIHICICMNVYIILVQRFNQDYLHNVNQWGRYEIKWKYKTQRICFAMGDRISGSWSNKYSGVACEANHAESNYCLHNSSALSPSSIVSQTQIQIQIYKYS